MCAIAGFCGDFLKYGQEAAPARDSWAKALQGAHELTPSFVRRAGFVTYIVKKGDNATQARRHDAEVHGKAVDVPAEDFLTVVKAASPWWNFLVELTLRRLVSW